MTSAIWAGPTTGTMTMRPLLRQRATAAIAASVLAEFELPASTRYLAVAPISHVSGTKVLPVLVRGGTVRLVTGFDPEHVLSIIARERIDFTLLVPTMIYTRLDCPALAHADTSSLQLLLYGASPMSPTRLREGLERFGPVFSQLYGQRQTALAFAHGWLHTGDLGRADEEGRLYIVDRKKDMIVTGGFNVYSREVEDAISQHPDVGKVDKKSLRARFWADQTRLIG